MGIKDRDTAALAIHLRFDAGTGAESPAAVAKEVFSAMANGWKDKVGHPSVLEAGTFVCVERPSLGPLALFRKDGELAILAGPTKTAVAGPWTSAGTCAQSRAWGKAVTAQK